ncbi:hypothetical protein ADK38_25485, partial [Streptomyces varsoviensis]
RSQWEREFNDRLDELNAPHSSAPEGEGRAADGDGNREPRPVSDGMGQGIARFGMDRGMSPREARNWGDRYTEAQHDGSEARSQWEREF